VPCAPTTTSRAISAAERQGAFALLASDGVWEVFSNERACMLVIGALAEGRSAHDAAIAAACVPPLPQPKFSVV